MYAIEIYNDSGFAGFLKSVTVKGFAVTKNIRYAKKYKNNEMDIAYGDCDHIAGCTNGQTLGSIKPLC